jgi:tRNA1Val (adenine37-N6)-methyltransferase
LESLTRGHFFDGAVVLGQPKCGYRFSVDAVLLAHLVDPEPGETVLDLGTGCGVVPVLMAYRQPAIRVVGVEIQPSLSRLARMNVAANQMADRIRILKKDMRKLTLADIGGPVDRVVTNPPYRKRNSGRVNPDGQKAIARHEIKIDLKMLLATACKALKRAGKCCVIYPSVRTADLIAAMRSTGLEPKHLTMIHSNAASAARLVAVVASKGGRPGLEIAPPLFLYREDGRYTPAVEAMFRG